MTIAKSAEGSIAAAAAGQPESPARSLKHRTISGTALVFSGTGVGQLIRLAGNLILTRILFPEAFGIMLIVYMVQKFVGLFSDFGIYGNIINHKRGEEELFLRTAWTAKAIRGIAIWLVCCALAWPAALIWEQPLLLGLIPLAGFSSVLLGFESMSIPLLNRRVRVGKIVALDVGSQIASLVVMIVVAALTKSVWALAVGGVIRCGSRAIISQFMVPGLSMRFALDREAIREILGYGIWIFAGTLLIYVVQNSGQFAMSWVVSETELGVFVPALFLSFAAVELVNMLARKILFPVYARLSDWGPDRLRRNMVKMRGSLLLAIVPALCCLSIFAHPIIDTLYDPRYVEAGWMLQILAIGSIGMVISATASSVLLAKRDSKRFAILQATRAVFMVVGLAVGYHLGGVPGMLWGLTIARIVDYPALAWAIHKYGVWTPGLDLAVYAFSAITLGLGWWWVV